MTEIQAIRVVEALKLWIERTYKISEHNFHPQSRENALQDKAEQALINALSIAN